MRLRRSKDRLLDNLRDPDYAYVYLKRAAAESLEELLYALLNVARARDGGVSATAAETELTRENLHRTLRRTGNPHARTLDTLLKTLGLRLDVARRGGIEPVATPTDTESVRS